MVHRTIEWSKSYGDIYSLKVLSGTMIVLNSPRAVTELMFKRSQIYANRPQDWITNNTFKGNNLGFLDASDQRWKDQRKVSVQNLAVC
jgi:hypothetical protein